MQQIGFFIAKFTVRSTRFGAPLCPSSGAQELCRWLLPVVLGALVYRSLVWCGAVGYVSGLRDVSHAHRQELKSYADGCCLWYLALWFTGRWSGLELWVMCLVCGMFHSSTPVQRPVNQSAKYHRQQPSA